jgi:hypothetical protein
MRRGRILNVLFLFFLIFIIPQTIADTNIMSVESNIIRGTASVSVPDTIFLGNVTRGYSIRSDKVYINNTGNVDITVTPQLENSSEEIYSNLYFSTTTTESSFRKIGNFSLNLSKPDVLGGVESDYIYIKLDLTNYNKTVPSDLISYKKNIRFIAMAR